MAEFIVHSIPGSPFGQAVLATLIEKNAPWRLTPVAPTDIKQPAHLARHPFGRVPAFEHDGFTLYETQAILRYIDRVLPEPPLTPSQPQDAARMDLVLAVSDWYLFQGVTSVIGFERVIKPFFLGGQPDEAAIANVMPKAQQVFAELSRLLGQDDYFVGARLTLADLHVAPFLSMLSATPEWATLTAERPNLVTWLSHMLARPSLAQTSYEKLAALAA